MVCSQEMFRQNVVFVIFRRKPHMGFGHMVDVMVVWIPWVSVDGYIDKMKNNNDTPCHWVIWQFDPLEKKRRPNIHNHMVHT